MKVHKSELQDLVHQIKSAKRILWLILFSFVQGCVSQHLVFDSQAEQLGFIREVYEGREFRHVIYTRSGEVDRDVLHVYLDGDGQPWIANRIIAADPTPTNPMMLELMGLDRAPAIYLGRPCYHGLVTDPSCDPALWTSARYSLRVVTSMNKVLRDYVSRNGYRKVVLIGHSGGGTLAMLLAERIENIQAVVTIAGNLDIAAWAKLHGYSRLVDSLNPADRPGLDARIQQYHLIGLEDDNVPLAIVAPYLETQSNAEVLQQEGFDHACCWNRIWPEFLIRLAGSAD